MRARNKSSDRRLATGLSSWHGSIWLYAAFFLVGILATIAFKGLFPKTPAAATQETAQMVSKSQGPWGNLEYTTMWLERPDESFPDTIPQPQPIDWRFESYTPEQITALFQGADLTEAQKQLLLERSRWKQLTNGWSVLPPLELVRDMSSAARSTLYGALKKIRSNDYIYSPVHLPVERFETWLNSSGLEPRNKELVRRLALRDRDRVSFYDAQLMEWLCAPAEKRAFAKAMAQAQTLLMRLRITPQSNINALTAYWARGSRGIAMKAFLESLARVPEGASVSISFFFPTFARMRLYTFPDMRNDRLAYHQDCFWTAMNFFNEQPDYSFFNPEQIQAKLRAEYTPVNSPSAFGDLILLRDGDTAIHMCVYVADDVVFTKNGASTIAPWVLMKMSEMLREYAYDHPVKMIVYRKKDI